LRVGREKGNLGEGMGGEVEWSEVK